MAGRPADPGRALLVAGAVTVVAGAALVGAALWVAQDTPASGRELAFVAAGTAAAAAAVGATILLGRLLSATTTAPGSRRPPHGPLPGIVVTLAGLALVVAAALAGAARAVTVAGPLGGDVPRIAVHTGRTADGTPTARVEVTMGGLDAGAPITVSVAADGSGDPPLASAVHWARGDAHDTVRVDAVLSGVRTAAVDVSVPGRHCRAVLPVAVQVSADDVTVTCRRG